MAWANASGQPVATQSVTVQFDVPCEAADPKSVGAPNLIAVVMAVIQLFAAMQSGNPAAIMAAFQALLVALKG